MSKTNSDGQTFGSWLLVERGRTGQIGQLLEIAKADRSFPRYGTPQDVREHLARVRAEQGMFDAVDKAELDWLRA
jgi:hypothetical protein